MTVRHGPKMFCGRLALLVMVVATSGCRPRVPPVPTLPPGFLFNGPGSQIDPLLQRLASMTTTPIGEAATGVRARLAGCERVSGHGTDPVAFITSLSCSTTTPTTTTTEAATWALPAVGGQRFVGAGAVDEDGTVRLTGTLQPSNAGEAAFALDEAPPTTSILRPGKRAVWAHVRVDGDFDPTRLMPASGGQADDLFAVNSTLALRGLTTGEIELGLFPPQTERSFPVSVVAVGIRTQAGAKAVLASLVERLEQRWSTKAHDAIIAGRPGTCLPEVNILPDFAPCALVTDDDLIIGWNAYALEVGLADSGEVVPVSAHQIAFDFTRFVEADGQLERALAQGRPVLKQPYPWSTFRLTIDAPGGGPAKASVVLEGPSL